jgi:hypothetical protein
MREEYMDKAFNSMTHLDALVHVMVVLPEGSSIENRVDFLEDIYCKENQNCQ